MRVPMSKAADKGTSAASQRLTPTPPSPPPKATPPKHPPEEEEEEVLLEEVRDEEEPRQVEEVEQEVEDDRIKRRSERRREDEPRPRRRREEEDYDRPRRKKKKPRPIIRDIEDRRRDESGPLDGFFGDLNGGVLFLFAFCCTGIALIFGVAGIFLTRNAEARRNAIMLTVASMIFFVLGILISLVRIAVRGR
jgi:hypothetical protein